MPKKRRSCKNEHDTFCFICGELTALKHRGNVTDQIKRLHYAYFGCVVGDLDKVWFPHYYCLDYNGKLSKWLSKWFLFTEFAACSKTTSRDNHRKTSYPRTQQRDQGAG